MAFGQNRDRALQEQATAQAERDARKALNAERIRKARQRAFYVDQQMAMWAREQRYQRALRQSA